jgi:anti-sigma B factor antagonist
MEPEAAVLMVEIAAGPGGDVVATIRGDLDLGAGPSLLRAIEDVFATAPPSVTLDLAGITFLDSSGLGALLTVHARCQSVGIAFSAVNPPPAVSRVLELTNLTEVFNFH